MTKYVVICFWVKSSEFTKLNFESQKVSSLICQPTIYEKKIYYNDQNDINLTLINVFYRFYLLFGFTEI